MCRKRLIAVCTLWLCTAPLAMAAEPQTSYPNQQNKPTESASALIKTIPAKVVRVAGMHTTFHVRSASGELVEVEVPTTLQADIWRRPTQDKAMAPDASMAHATVMAVDQATGIVTVQADTDTVIELHVSEDHLSDLQVGDHLTLTTHVPQRQQ